MTELVGRRRYALSATLLALACGETSSGGDPSGAGAPSAESGGASGAGAGGATGAGAGTGAGGNIPEYTFEVGELAPGLEPTLTIPDFAGASSLDATNDALYWTHPVGTAYRIELETSANSLLYVAPYFGGFGATIAGIDERAVVVDTGTVHLVSGSVSTAAHVLVESPGEFADYATLKVGQAVYVSEGCSRLGRLELSTGSWSAVDLSGATQKTTALAHGDGALFCASLDKVLVIDPVTLVEQSSLLRESRSIGGAAFVDGALFFIEHNRTNAPDNLALVRWQPPDAPEVLGTMTGELPGNMVFDAEALYWAGMGTNQPVVEYLRTQETFTTLATPSYSPGFVARNDTHLFWADTPGLYSRALR